MAFNVNVFCHRSRADRARERAWLDAAAGLRAVALELPAAIGEIFTSFNVAEAMLELLVERRPAVVSFTSSCRRRVLSSG